MCILCPEVCSSQDAWLVVGSAWLIGFITHREVKYTDNPVIILILSTPVYVSSKYSSLKVEFQDHITYVSCNGHLNCCVIFGMVPLT